MTPWRITQRMIHTRLAAHREFDCRLWGWFQTASSNLIYDVAECLHILNNDSYVNPTNPLRNELDLYGSRFNDSIIMVEITIECQILLVADSHLEFVDGRIRYNRQRNDFRDHGERLNFKGYGDGRGLADHRHLNIPNISQVMIFQNDMKNIFPVWLSQAELDWQLKSHLRLLEGYSLILFRSYDFRWSLDWHILLQNVNLEFFILVLL